MLLFLTNKKQTLFHFPKVNKEPKRPEICLNLKIHYQSIYENQIDLNYKIFIIQLKLIRLQFKFLLIFACSFFISKPEPKSANSFLLNSINWSFLQQMIFHH